MSHIETLTGPNVANQLDDLLLDQVRVEHEDDNTLLQDYWRSAVGYVETFTRLRLITQTVRLTRTGFGPAVNLPIGPIQSVDSVSYLDDAGTWQTVNASVYRFIASGSQGELEPAFGQIWPIPQAVSANVRIELTVGFGDALADVPRDIVAATRLYCAHLYENREASVIGVSASELPMGLHQILMPHRIWV